MDEQKGGKEKEREEEGENEGKVEGEWDEEEEEEGELGGGRRKRGSRSKSKRVKTETGIRKATIGRGSRPWVRSMQQTRTGKGNEVKSSHGITEGGRRNYSQEEEGEGEEDMRERREERRDGR